MIRRKLRPEHLGRPDFRISNLPEQKVADTQITARTDKQIRRRQALGIQMVFNYIIIYIFYGKSTVGSFRRNGTYSMQDFCLSAVVYSQIQNNTGVVFRCLYCVLHLLLHNLRQTFTRADKTHLYVIFVKFVNFVGQITAQKLHDEVYFRHRTLPVFCRKCISTDNLNSQLISCTDNSFQCFRSGLMAKGTHLALSLSPATVAVHNNSNMLRNILHIQILSMHYDIILSLIFCLKQASKHKHQALR